MVNHDCVTPFEFTGLPGLRRCIRRRHGLAAWAFALTGLALGCRTAPIHDLVNGALPEASYEASISDRDEAIWRAGRKSGWEIERIGPGVLKGTWRFRNHLAIVLITHDLHQFNIRYEGSRNLMHSGDRIHRKYNRLVEDLADWIQREPARPTVTGESG